MQLSFQKTFWLWTCAWLLLAAECSQQSCACRDCLLGQGFAAGAAKPSCREGLQEELGTGLSQGWVSVWQPGWRPQSRSCRHLHSVTRLGANDGLSTTRCPACGDCCAEAEPWSWSRGMGKQPSKACERQMTHAECWQKQCHQRWRSNGGKCWLSHP